MVLDFRLLERYKLLKNLAQGRDFLRQRLDEKLIAKVRKSSPLFPRFVDG